MKLQRIIISGHSKDRQWVTNYQAVVLSLSLCVEQEWWRQIASTVPCEWVAAGQETARRSQSSRIRHASGLFHYGQLYIYAGVLVCLHVYMYVWRCFMHPQMMMETDCGWTEDKFNLTLRYSRKSIEELITPGVHRAITNDERVRCQYIPCIILFLAT